MRAPIAELTAWWLWAGVVALVLAAAVGGSPRIALALALTCAAIVVGLYRRYARRPVTAADRVTFARVGITCAIAGVAATGLGDPSPPGLVLTAAAAIALALDGLDGMVARRRRATRLGARFDMEADSLLLLVLCIAVAPGLGWWVLLIGGARYAFWAAGFAFEWLTRPLPPSPARKGVAAAQGVALLVPASGLLPPAAGATVCALALAALVWSFGRDVLWLWRHAPSGRGHRLPRATVVALKVGVGVAILVFLGVRLGTDAFVTGVTALTLGGVAWALGIGAVTTVASALRWRVVADRFGTRLGAADAVAAYYRSIFLNAALPAGVLGDADRAVRHAVASGSPGPAARAVIIERVIGQAVLWVATVLVLVVAPAGFGRWSPWAAPTTIGATIGVVVVVALPLWCVFARRRARVAGRGGTVGRALRELRRLSARDTWPQLLALSGVVLAGHVTMFVVAARSVGAHDPVPTLLPMLLLALVAMSVPANIGGWGPREGASAWAFGAAGLGAELGMSVAVAYGVLAFIAGLPGVPVWLAGRRLPGARAERDEARARRERITAR